MYIHNLPSEIVDHIFYLGGHHKSKMIIANCTLNNTPNLSRQLMALRIQLAYKIHKHYKIIKRFIFCELNILFNTPQNMFEYNAAKRNVTHLMLKNKTGTCAYYAPHKPNGICRKCTKLEDKHFMSNDIIEGFYLPLYISTRHIY